MRTSWSVSAFPGISLRTDNSHKRKALWNSGVQRPRHTRSLHLSSRLREAHKMLRLLSRFPFWLLSRRDFPTEPQVTARDRFQEQSARREFAMQLPMPAFFPMLSRTLDTSQITVVIILRLQQRVPQSFRIRPKRRTLDNANNYNIIAERCH